MDQGLVTLVVGCLGIGGTIGGVIAGQYMARSWQREQWMLDRKMDEYRELISVLTETFAYHSLHRGQLKAEPDEATQAKLDESELKSLQTIRDRILIADELEKYQIRARWIAALKRFDDDHDNYALAAEFHAICNCLVERAVEVSKDRNSLDDIIERIRKDVAASGGFQ